MRVKGQTSSKPVESVDVSILNGFICRLSRFKYNQAWLNMLQSVVLPLEVFNFIIVFSILMLVKTVFPEV